jgi:hypothetical protein
VAVYDLWDPERNRGIYCHAKVQMYDDELLVCGSGNLNRRSFTCDTEVDCAAWNPALVREHRRRLWSVLFPRVPPERAQPPLPDDLSVEPSSAAFFAAFRDAAARPGSCLVPDPWREREPHLPNGGARRGRVWLAYSRTYNRFIDPTSIDLAIERGRCPHPGSSHDVGPPGRLDELVALLEDCREPSDSRARVSADGPFRRPA